MNLYRPGSVDARTTAQVEADIFLKKAEAEATTAILERAKELAMSKEKSDVAAELDKKIAEQQEIISASVDTVKEK